MGEFSQTLNFLGIAGATEESFQTCSVWSGKEETAFDERLVSMLQVRTYSSQSGLERELSSLRSIPPVAIMTTIQERKKIKEILEAYGVRTIEIEDEILFKHASKKFGGKSHQSTEGLYIHPTVRDKKNKRNGEAIKSLVSWLRSDALDDRLAIITGNAGFGKTTFCKELATTLQSFPNLARIPIYIDSHHWRHLVNEKRFSVRSACSEAVANAYPNSAIGEEAIEHLISRGAILPIFDGLDELCTDAYTEASVGDIISQMEAIFEDESAGKAIFTSRSTFWSDARSSERMKMYEYEVLPFDKAQRDEFLEGWFKLHSGKRRFAEQMLSIIDTTPASTATQANGNSVRFTQSPYILRLVCLSATRRQGGDFDRSEFVNRHDPLDDIIIAAGNREIQKTGIPYSTQCDVLFALSLMHGDTFSIEEFRSTMTFYDLPEDTFDGMLSHHFIGNYGSRKSFLFKGMGDYLRAKALAEFIYKENDRFFGIEEYLSQINNLKDTSVEIFAGISSFYSNVVQLKEYFGARRTRKHFRDRTAQGLIFLLASCGKKAFNLNREEVSNLLSDVLLDGQMIYEGLEFSCHFEGFDFRGFKFSHCGFKDVVFKDCTFDDGTVFHHCIFDGDFEVQGQSGFDDVNDKECMFNSMEARSTFENRSTHASSRKVTLDDIKILFREVLRLLRSSSGNFVDIRREGVLSRLQRKNSYLASDVLESMEKNSVLRIRNGTKGHRARLEVDNIDDALAFWNDGAEIGTIRDAISQISRKYCV